MMFKRSSFNYIFPSLFEDNGYNGGSYASTFSWPINFNRNVAYIIHEIRNSYNYFIIKRILPRNIYSITIQLPILPPTIHERPDRGQRGGISVVASLSGANPAGRVTRKYRP